MTRTESTVCWLGWGILALVSMYGCTGGTVRADEIVAPAMETPNLVVETPDLAEGWQSPIGLDDEFTQEGDRFTWKVDGLRQDGCDRIRDERLDASWNVGRDRGMSAGEATEADGDYALRIEWANGVVFTREAQ